MIFVAGVDRHSYWLVFSDGVAIPEIPCPDASCEGVALRGHGWHGRYLEGVKVQLRRSRCPGCGVTHVILPEDVVAYRDAYLSQVETVLSTSGGPTARARALRGEATGSSVRRVRWWMRSLRQGWVMRLGALLPPGPGDLWSRVTQAMGEPPGTLVRLRRWLWSRYSLLLGGLTDLYRCGRPAWRIRHAGPEVGSSAL